MKYHFEYKVRDKIVDIYWNTRIVKTIKGKQAQDFINKLPEADNNQIELMLAELTGNFKRGNERMSKSHNRNSEY